MSRLKLFLILVLALVLAPVALARAGGSPPPTEIIPAWADDSHQECGVSCQYAKGNELLIQEHEVLAKTIAAASNQSATESDKMSILGNWCLTGEKSKDCLDRVKLFQAKRDAELSRDYVLNTSHQQDLDMTKLSADGQGPLFNNEFDAKNAALKPQVSPIETTEELKQTYEAERKIEAKAGPDHLAWFGSPSYDKWVSAEFATPPKQEEYLQTKLVDDPSLPGHKIDVLVLDANGNPVPDVKKFNAALVDFNQTKSNREKAIQALKTLAKEKSKTQSPLAFTPKPEEISNYESVQQAFVNLTNGNLIKNKEDSKKNFTSGKSRIPATVGTFANTKIKSVNQVHDATVGGKNLMLTASAAFLKQDKECVENPDSKACKKLLNR